MCDGLLTSQLIRTRANPRLTSTTSSFSSDPLFYITDILLPPILFGIGILGNILLLVVLNRKHLRCNSPVYVYLTGIATVDLVALLGAVPGFLQTVSVLPLRIAHGREMVTATWLHVTLLQPACRQAVGWLAALMTVARYAEVIDQRISSKSREKIPTRSASSSLCRRLTRISASRIFVFVVVIFCFLLNITRLFDVSVVPMPADCFDVDDNSVDVVTLWTRNVTTVAVRSRLTRDVIPVVASIAGHVVPLVMSAVLAFALICCHVTCTRLARSAIIMRAPTSHDDAELQLNVCVAIVVLFVVAFESLGAILSVFEAFIHPTFAAFFEIGTRADDIILPPPQPQPAWFRSATLISVCLGLARSSINFVILLLINHSFRTCLRRTFCCCVEPGDADEYFEPIRCCGRRSSADEYNEGVGCYSSCCNCCRSCCSCCECCVDSESECDYGGGINELSSSSSSTHDGEEEDDGDEEEDTPGQEEREREKREDDDIFVERRDQLDGSPSLGGLKSRDQSPRVGNIYEVVHVANDNCSSLGKPEGQGYNGAWRGVIERGVDQAVWI